MSADKPVSMISPFLEECQADMSPIANIVRYANRSEFNRYFCAGSLTFLTDFTILFLLTEFFGINDLWSTLVAVSVGLPMS